MSKYIKTGRRLGESHPGTKLTARQVIEIFTSSDKEDYLAALYNVSQNAISNIKTRKTWSHLTINIPKET